MTTDLTSTIDATENALFAASCEYDITVTVREDDEDTIVVGWMTEDADFDWEVNGERVDDAVAAAARAVLEAHGFDCGTPAASPSVCPAVATSSAGTGTAGSASPSSRTDVDRTG